MRYAAVIAAGLLMTWGRGPLAAQQTNNNGLNRLDLPTLTLPTLTPGKTAAPGSLGLPGVPSAVRQPGSPDTALGEVNSFGLPLTGAYFAPITGALLAPVTGSFSADIAGVGLIAAPFTPGAFAPLKVNALAPEALRPTEQSFATLTPVILVPGAPAAQPAPPAGKAAPGGLDYLRLPDRVIPATAEDKARTATRAETQRSSASVFQQLGNVLEQFLGIQF